MTGPHVPFTHWAEPWPTAHDLPQAPQLPLPVSAVSQPAAPVQSPKPSWHLPIAHTPLTQLASAFGNEQTFPHVPQFAASICRSTHLTPHVSGAEAAQLTTQVCVLPMLAQNGASALQDVPQPPQVSGRVMLVSHPSSTLVVQCAKPSAQPSGGTKQIPCRHSTAAPGRRFGRAPQS